MNREQNEYINRVTGEVLTATEMLTFVKEEAKRQFEELNEQAFSSMTIQEQQECIMEQFMHQLNNRDWEVLFGD
jgi:hypothetical protein